jgi:hypothetical protein
MKMKVRNARRHIKPSKKVEITHIVGCYRVNTLNYNAPYVASTIRKCADCEMAIYVALSTPARKGAKYMCLQCIDWDAITKIEPPTSEQWEEIGKIGRDEN